MTCHVPDIEMGDEQVKADAIRIGQYKDGEFPTDSKEFARRIFFTVYMGTENRYTLDNVRDSLMSGLIFFLVSGQSVTTKNLKRKYV